MMQRQGIDHFSTLVWLFLDNASDKINEVLSVFLIEFNNHSGVD